MGKLKDSDDVYIPRSRYTTGTQYTEFFRWWVEFLGNSTDPTRGVVCPLGTAGPTTEALYLLWGGIA